MTKSKKQGKSIAKKDGNEGKETPLTRERFFKVLNKVIGTKKPDEKRSGARKTKTSE